MGVRSSATLVESSNYKIVIDPSAALAPKRFELPPSEREQALLKNFKTGINSAASTADIIIISHYHHDHFDPEARYYGGKKLFLKSWDSAINRSQKERSKKLRHDLEKLVEKPSMTAADGLNFRFEEGLELSFTHALPHGTVGTNLGYVIMTTIEEDGFVFIHSSDVQGPVERSTAEIIISKNPDIIYLDGPPSHLINSHFSVPDLEKAINNICDIITYTRAVVILDHHIVRDRAYKELLKQVYEQGLRVQTAAEYMKQDNLLLEANRDLLERAGGDLFG